MAVETATVDANMVGTRKEGKGAVVGGGRRRRGRSGV